MSNDFDAEGDGIKQLRQKFDELAAQKKALEEENAKLARAAKKASVTEVLKAKGLPAEAADLYNSDETSEDAVNQWIDKYATVFGVKQDTSQDNGVRAIGSATAPESAVPSLTSDGGQNHVLGDPEQIMQLMNSAANYSDLQKLLGFPQR